MRVLEITSGRRFAGLDLDARGRNFLFELECACLLLDIGFLLTDSGDGDIAATWEGNRVLGECKRPKAPAQVLTRISKASRQIESRRTKGEIGIVFLDLTVVVNPLDAHYCVAKPEEARHILNGALRVNSERLFLGMRSFGSPSDACICARLKFTFWHTIDHYWLFYSKWMSIPNPNASVTANEFRVALDTAAKATVGFF
jgi:hypothetical protein